MSNNYYYLVAGLPDLSLDDNKLSYTLENLCEELRENLSVEDYSLLDYFKFEIDNKNILNMINKNPNFDDGGSISSNDLEEAIKDPLNANIPIYMIDFLEQYKSEAIKKDEAEMRLTELYFNHLSTIKNQFLRNYFEFLLNLKNILTGLNCRKFNLSIENNIIGDNSISKALKKQSSKDFGLTSEFPKIEEIISAYEDKNIIDREYKLDMVMWKYIEEETISDYFSTEKVLSFYIMFKMVNRWILLDERKGREMLLKLRNSLEGSFDIKEKF